MDQITDGDSSAKELIILLVKQLSSLESYVQKLDTSMLALMNALIEARPEFARTYLRHMNAAEHPSGVGVSSQSDERARVYAEVIRRLKEM